MQSLNLVSRLQWMTAVIDESKELFNDFAKISHVAIPIIAITIAASLNPIYPALITFSGGVFSAGALKEIFENSNPSTIRKTILIATVLIGCGSTALGLQWSYMSALWVVESVMKMNVDDVSISLAYTVFGSMVISFGVSYIQALFKKISCKEKDDLEFWIQNPLRKILAKDKYLNENILLFDYIVRRRGIYPIHDALYQLIFNGHNLDTIEKVSKLINDLVEYRNDDNDEALSKIFLPYLMTFYDQMIDEKKEDGAISILSLIEKNDLRISGDHLKYLDDFFIKLQLRISSRCKEISDQNLDLIIKKIEQITESSQVNDEALDQDIMKALKLRREYEVLYVETQLYKQCVQKFDAIDGLGSKEILVRCATIIKHPIYKKIENIQSHRKADLIDMEQAGWDYLGSNLIATFDELKDWTGATDVPSLAKKMNELGLPSLKALMERDLVTKEEYDHLDKGKVTIKAKVKAYLESKRLSILHALDLMDSKRVIHKPLRDLVKHINKVIIPWLIANACYFAVILPILRNPLLGAAGAVLGYHADQIHTPHLNYFHFVGSTSRMHNPRTLANHSWFLQQVYLIIHLSIAMVSKLQIAGFLQGYAFGRAYRFHLLSQERGR